MKGDFTRFTFNANKHYNRVLKQQGRVDLDADWNEAADIQTYLDRTLAIDVIGPVGVPKNDSGLRVTSVKTDGSDFSLSEGRIYVDGILCELTDPTEASYLTQPDLPDPPALTPQVGVTDLVYLHVWERHITALEDPDIQEVALGGPDTATRVRTVWQVQVNPNVNSSDCKDFKGWSLPASDGQLTVNAIQPPASTDPCVISPIGGYRGLENRLYRVEIHDGSQGGAPTFKWSRDNGSVVFAVEEFILGDPHKVKVKRLGRDQVLALHISDWVEVLDEDSELSNLPGTLAQITDLDEAQRILTLSKPISGYSLTRHARVRRWDQTSDAIPVAAGPIPLEDGIEVRFGGSTFKTGDYWTFTARTAIGDVDHLVSAPPQGIVHHYYPLALITWKKTGTDWTPQVENCPPSFPPLTQICAEDVCFDNSQCQLPGAETVQDALDRLCAANDLRFHNKHLHGWGIVCGLEVVCGPDTTEGERHHVTLQDGYAIDCDGNDLLVNQYPAVDVMDAITQWNNQNPNTPILDASGNGDISLILALDANRQIQVSLEPYDPSKDTLRSLLSGTIWMDFYNDCIKSVMDKVKELFTPQAGEANALVGPTQERITTILNLMIQVNDLTNGQYVFLSAKEDKILRDLYELLRGLLTSETFCAMFANARQFPDYPFSKHNISTIFGKRSDNRLRLHPGLQYAYTAGADDKIGIYDLDKEEMAAEVDVPGGTGIIVRDVAFSPDGKQVYAIATMNGTDTVFAVADINGSDHVWRPVTVFCDLVLMTLATAPSLSNTVYASGRGKGLYAINPDNVPLNPQPIAAFNATGHLVMSEEAAMAYASARQAGLDPAIYDQVLGINLKASTASAQVFKLVDFTGAARTGQDDIAIVHEGDILQLAAVADPIAGGNLKTVILFNTASGAFWMADDVENTKVSLGHMPGSHYLMLGFEDSYRVGLIDLRKGNFLESYRMPVQISPLAIASSEKRNQVTVLNTTSRTITTIPADYLNPEIKVDVEPVPGSKQFLDALVTYRNGVLGAYSDLWGGLLQYLKDCFCDHLLVKCPTCDPSDKIYLAAISVRGNQVYKVCNFSKRKYVKSFPTVDYWLSIVPIMPLIGKVVERLCCMVLPDMFGKLVAPSMVAGTTKKAYFTAQQVRNGMTFFQKADIHSFIAQGVGKLNFTSGLVSDWAVNTVTRPSVPFQRVIKYTDVVGQPVADVTKQMADTNVAVAAVRPYDPAQGAQNVMLFTQSPQTITPGARVTLYEQNGVVRYYSLEQPADAIQSVQAQLKEQQATLSDVATLKASMAEFQTLQKNLVDLQSQLSTKDQELTTLCSQVQDLTQKQVTVDVAATQAKMAEMEAELKDLRSFRDEVTKFMQSKGG